MGRAFGLYYGEATTEQLLEVVKPYLYGYVTEAKVGFFTAEVAPASVWRAACRMRNSEGGPRTP